MESLTNPEEIARKEEPCALAELAKDNNETLLFLTLTTDLCCWYYIYSTNGKTSLGKVETLTLGPSQDSNLELLMPNPNVMGPGQTNPKHAIQLQKDYKCPLFAF